jgi:hypothetical protein
VGADFCRCARHFGGPRVAEEMKPRKWALSTMSVGSLRRDQTKTYWSMRLFEGCLSFQEWMSPKRSGNAQFALNLEGTSSG